MSDKFSWCADDICDGGSEVIILCYDEVEQYCFIILKTTDGK